MKTDQDFWNAYDRLSESGHCDMAGGMEYKRVLSEWDAMGRPDCIDQFIVARTNAIDDLEINGRVAGFSQLN